MADNEVRMMMSVVPGAMTGFAALNAGLVSINNVFGAMTRSIDAQFGLINAAVVTTGVVVAQLGADAMNSFGQFEQGMKIVQMVSGQTREEIGYLGQKANEFSVQYRMDIDQITEGLQTLGRAGLNSASEQAEVLQNGLNTAKLEGRDLNSVLQELIQNTALLGGNLKSPDFGEQSEYVNDLLVATSMTAPITTHDVSETLKYSGGIAAAAGADINSEAGKEILEDYMGAIAAFAQKGVTGSIAGTALRAFFNKPATQDSSVKEALGTLQLKPEYLWEEDEDTMKPVSEQIAIIEGQMEKLNISTMDRLQIWSKIVGGKMGQQMMKLHSEDIKEITSDIRSAEDASDLAAGSMKTYEANLKAAGEAGAVLERNVGERLVFFANPILDIINKILSFAQNDFMSWPIAIGILAFVGTLARKIRAIISSIKSEISTLYSGMQQGINYFTRKGGVVREGDNPINDDKRGSSSSKKSDSSSKLSSFVKKEEMPATLKAFDKKFAKTITQSGPFTYQAFKEAGISDERAALAGRLSGLTKAVKIGDMNTGIGEGQFWAAAIKNNLLSEAQINKMLGAYKSGANARPLADMIGIESVVAKVRACEQAMNELGLSMTAFNWSEEERISAENFVKQSIKETALAVMNETEVQKEKEAVEREAILVEEEKTIETQNSQKASSQSASSHKNEAAEARNAAGAVDLVTQAFNSFIPASQRLVQSLKTTPINGALGHENFVFNPIKTIDPTNRSLAMVGFQGFDAAIRDYWLLKALKMEEESKNKPKDTSTLSKKSESSITPRVQYRPERGDPQAEYYNRMADPYLTEDRRSKLPEDKRTVIGKYGGPSIVLTKEQQEEAAKKIGVGPTAKDSLKTELEKKAEQNVNEGTSLLTQGKKGVFSSLATHNSMKKSAEEMIHAEDQYTKSLEEQRNLHDKTAAQQYHRQQSVSRGSLPEGISGMGRLGIISRKEIEDIKQAAHDTHKYTNQLRRSLSRGSLSKEPSGFAKTGITSRKEIENLRKESAEQWKQATTPLGQRIQNRLDKMHEYQKAGGSEALLYKKNVEPWRKDGWGDNRPLTYYGINQAQRAQIADAEYEDFKKMRKNTLSGMSGGFISNFRDRLNRDRTGSFISFGKQPIDPKNLSLGLRSATTGLAGFGNKVMNATDLLGGPYMIAMMGVTSLIQLWQGLFQEFCENLKEASNKLQEAYSKWNEAENSLKQTYREGNPDATDDEIENMVLDTYSTMGDDMRNALRNGNDEYFKKMNLETAQMKEYEYDEEADDGTMKEKTEEELSSEEKYTEAIKQNTGALYQASAKLNTALDRYVEQAQDSWWGLDGWTGWWSDQFGGFMDLWKTGGVGSKFSDDNTFLLTASQADENYAGYKELAGIMLEDFKDSGGDLTKGLTTMMGEDAKDFLKIIPKASKDALQNMANFAAGKGKGGLTPYQNAKVQTSMKNDPKTWKNLAKELSKRDSAKKSGRNVEKSTKRIEGLVNKLNTSMGGGFNETQILQAAYIQQMQDMYAITQAAIVPMIQQNAQAAMATYQQATGINEKTFGVNTNTGGTYENAANIAALVAIIAQSQVKNVLFDTAVAGSTEPGHITDVNMSGGPGDEEDVAIIEAARNSNDANEFFKKITQDYDESTMSMKNGVNFKMNPIWEWGEKGIYTSLDTKMAPGLAYIALYQSTAKSTGQGYDIEAANKSGREYAEDIKKGGITFSEAINTSAKNYTESPKFIQSIVDAYNAAEEETPDSGGGNGSGSGSGDKDNDKNTGNKKERVDLVLCNKKEIPKLNVNLFKKPPSFTVLNKNFKLRDVKINTEDTPKAIMSSIKNAFIDVQKRTDPKIIQDEDAEYDPVEATDGNPLPSGTAKTRTG